MLKCDAVFEGGGVKGIGFAGAITALEDAGYTFENVVGTSAGAIASSLIAAGYTGLAIKDILKDVDYRKFRQKPPLLLPGVSSMLTHLISYYGLYKSEYFERWLHDLLKKQGVRVFSDIRTQFKEEKYRYRCQVTACDLNAQTLLILPQDIRRLGILPDNFEVSKAVQMSISIPFFYEPVRMKVGSECDHFIVDGGLLSKYPIFMLDDGSPNPPWPTFGMKFTSDEEQEAVCIENFMDYCRATMSTLLDGNDNSYALRIKGDEARSILISTTIDTPKGRKTISATDFDITRQESDALYENGYRAAKAFLRTWNFEDWKRKYRKRPE